MSDSPLKIHQAYIVQSSLFYFPAFLEDAKSLIKPLRFLAQGDMETLMEREEPGFDWTRLQDWPCYDSFFIRRIGTVLDPRAQVAWEPEDDWDTQADDWLVSHLGAPHTGRGHLPYLVPANWTFRLVNPPEGLPGFHLRPTLKLHVFPYGVVDALLCTEFFSRPGLDVSHFTQLVNGLSHVRRRRGRGAVFEVASANSVGQAHPRLNTSEILGDVADTLSRGLFETPQALPQTQDPLDASLAVLLFLNHTDPPFSPTDHAAEMCGLATGNERWSRMAPERVKPYIQSDYGLYEGDYIKLGRLHSIVRVDYPRRRTARRRFYWSLLSRIQLARVEAFLYRLYTSRLNDLWREHQEDRQKAWEAFKRWVSMKGDYMPEGDLFYFWDDLPGFSGQSLGGHRKVYEQAAALADVEKRRQVFAQELSTFMEYGLRTESQLVTIWNRVRSLHQLLNPFLKGGSS